ncbi:GyrI-like domain-containing protein [Notoacmeibacter sp. MSK16QG-6]|uniref:GyrI-like domain-containing protein n=1 Tax=Notoacmeibacter sp. MSK16QG-6 TaxID=2957982 RepID=UPI00209D4005|nr:GyrI-like domain-containing protein [Notoacmeibacter sp. MSK16QG-6]MCP1198829.1 GyrI-like domain-containing protein [Notoacmeibacter sp. MSK16QG-6]
MRDVHETAGSEAILSIPSVQSFDAMAYVAIAVECAMAELPQKAPEAFPRLHEWCAEKGIELGEGLFRYMHFTADGRTLVHVANLVEKSVSVPDGGEVFVGELPAGNYAVASHTGPYDVLYDSTVMLEGWLRGRRLEKDEARAADKFEPACQVEIYRSGPWQNVAPSEWRTELRMKLSDG